jgi:pilus assembly protein CpaE
MAKLLNVLLAGRSERTLRPLLEMLSDVHDVECKVRMIGGGRTDTLSDLEPLPDLVVLRFDADDREELAALADSSSDSRPPLVVIGPADDPALVRLAVRGGARDFLPEPLKAEDLVAAIDRLREVVGNAGAGGRRADVVTVIGAAGGVGTSLVACNLALALANGSQAPTLLVDLDLRAAPLASFLDLSPERGIPAALAEIECLDDHALPGYLARHKSGLKLLGAPDPSMVSSRDVDVERFASLMGVLVTHHRYVVVDAARGLDDLAATTIGMAKRVVLVVQQSVVQVRQAARALGTICNQIGLPSDRVAVVVNRFSKRSTVSPEDIRHALGNVQLTLLPSEYKTVLASIDSGIPLLEYDPRSDVARAIVELGREIASGTHVERRGLLRRALPLFSGG